LASFGAATRWEARRRRKIFIPVWLAVATVNLWIGVSKAGYTIRDELPILLIVFALPAAAAASAIWQLSRS
jgi:hypothetical protein